jgi:hypothetical protein
MLWYRAFLRDQAARETQTSRLQDNGPQTAKVKRAGVTYKQTSIPEQTFIAAHEGYRLDTRGVDRFFFERQ